MVELPEFRAWQYQAGVERLRTSFRASIAPFEQAAYDTLQGELAHLAGSVDDGEYDADGVMIASTAVNLQYATIEAALAAQLVREAFVTSAFHYWERSARLWTGSAENFAQLVHAARAHGHEIHPDLPFLNSLNNLLKHDSLARGREVFARRPQLFLWGREPTGASWQDSVRLTNADVEEMLRIVERSGPSSQRHHP